MAKSKSQLDKFKEAARDLECDDDDASFANRLGKLVKRKEPKSKKETPVTPNEGPRRGR